MDNSGQDPSSKPKYIPPTNALTDLALCVPRNLRAVFYEVAEEVEGKRPAETWPDVPYHYGMGRIFAYEQWLERLTEDELKAEIARCRAAYEAHYRACAYQVFSKMFERGIDLSPYIVQQQRQSAKVELMLSRRPETHERDHYDGPTLGGGRSR